MKNVNKYVEEERKLYYYAGGALCLWGLAHILTLFASLLLGGNSLGVSMTGDVVLYDGLKGFVMLVVGGLSIKASHYIRPSEQESEAEKDIEGEV